MALNFPTSPTLNQVYTDGNYSFVWDGNSWVAGGSIASATVFDNKIDAAFIQANAAYNAANSSFIHANAAYNAANSAANNISAGSITGDKLGLTSINANNIVDGAVTGNKLGLTSINANNIVNGGVTVDKGGTGLSTLTANSVVLGNGTDPVQLIAPGTTGNVLTSNGTNWTSQAAAAGGGDYIMQVYAGPSTGTWTKPAGLKAIKVTVIGGGGGAGTGGTSSFGSPAFLSATGGGGAGGSGSGGQLNAPGQNGGQHTIVGCPPTNFKAGGSSAFGFGAGAEFNTLNGGTNGKNYGGGATSTTGGRSGGGGAIEYIDAPALPGPQPYTAGAGGSADGSTGTGGVGVVIVEEFY